MTFEDKFNILCGSESESGSESEHR